MERMTAEFAVLNCLLFAPQKPFAIFMIFFLRLRVATAPLILAMYLYLRYFEIYL